MTNPSLKAARHIKKRAAKVDELPREEEKDPGHGGVAGCAGAEDFVALDRVGIIALVAEIARTEAEDDDGKGSKNAAGHENTVNAHIEEELGCEDAVFELRCPVSGFREV